MIPIQDETITIEKSSNFRSVLCGISEEGTAHILSILRKKLYSHPELAVVREIATNAYDAHVEKGIPNRKIKITVPTSWEKYYICRDFGKGLTPDEIKHIYANYGSSTKRESNEVVGFYGIGSKSPFAICDSFFVTSWVGGYKYIYNVYLDPTDRGAIDLISKEKSDEESGLEVKVPVKDSQIQNIKAAVANFFLFWENRPEFEGDSVYFAHLEPFVKRENWAYYKSRSNSFGNHILIGCVTYPFDYKAIKSEMKEIWDSFESTNCDAAFERGGFVLQFPIGSLDVSASRESISYSPITKNRIKEFLKGIITEIVSEFEVKIQSASHLWDAKITYNEYFGMHGMFYGFRKAVNTFTWGGFEITDNIFNFDYRQNNISLDGYYKSHGRRYKEVVKNFSEERIEAREKEIIIINDNAKCLKRRMEKLIFSNVYAKAILVNCTPEVWEKFVTETGFDGPVKKLSELPYDKIERDSSGERAASTNSYKFLVKGYYNYRDEERKIKSESIWIKDKIKLSNGGVYVKTEGNYIHSGGRELNASELKDKIKSLNTNFNIVVPDVYTFSSNTFEKVRQNPKWIEFSEYVKNELNKYVHTLSDVKWVVFEKKFGSIGDFNQFANDMKDCWPKTNPEIEEFFSGVPGSLEVTKKKIEILEENLKIKVDFEKERDKTLESKWEKLSGDFPLLSLFVKKGVVGSQIAVKHYFENF